MITNNDCWIRIESITENSKLYLIEMLDEKLVTKTYSQPSKYDLQ